MAALEASFRLSNVSPENHRIAFKVKPLEGCSIPSECSCGILFPGDQFIVRFLPTSDEVDSRPFAYRRVVHSSSADRLERFVLRHGFCFFRQMLISLLTTETLALSGGKGSGSIPSPGKSFGPGRWQRESTLPTEPPFSVPSRQLLT